MLLRFGQLQSVLASHARYLKKVDLGPGALGQYPRWKTITFAEHKALHPNSSPQMFVLEVIGQLDVLAHCEADDDGDGDINVKGCIYPPSVLQRPNASCIGDACDRASSALSMDALKAFAREDPSTIIIVGDVPDNWKANAVAISARCI